MGYGKKYSPLTSVLALVASGGFSGFVAASPVHAAEAAEAVEEAPAASDEIIVTARRREESLSTIPVAVSAFNAAELEQRGVVDIRDFANVSPST